MGCHPLSVVTAITVQDTAGGESAAMRLALLSIALAVIALLAAHWISHRAEQRLGYSDHRDAHVEL